MKGLEICPAASAGLWCEYGDALYALERYDQAHEAFERACRINPEDPRVHLSLGWSHSALWRVEEAIRSLARGIELDESNLYGEHLVEKLKSVIEQRDAITEMKQHYRTQRIY
ncbi:MAG: tetratricopeptide repeat protein [Myxococcota bacterium]|nr:tetratricopeptide repeat protein [Myxococcota bacterium]